MKAVLVIDAPKEWIGEKLYAYIRPLEFDSVFCRVMELRPLPPKYGIDIDEPYAKGYNACIDEITGETE